MHTGHRAVNEAVIVYVLVNVFVCVYVFLSGDRPFCYRFAADTRIECLVFGLAMLYNGVGQYGCSRVAIHLIVKFITKQVISRRSARARIVISASPGCTKATTLVGRRAKQSRTVRDATVRFGSVEKQ